MKIFKYLLITLFALNAIGSFIAKHYDAGFGWACAFLCEFELLNLRKKLKDKNE